MLRFGLPVVASAILTMLCSAQTQQSKVPAAPDQRITVTCDNCSSKARAELTLIATGIVQTEATACFKNYFKDHPPTEVETRVATAPNVDICGTDQVTVTPKTPSRRLMMPSMPPENWLFTSDSWVLMGR
jgi:hypothetical protein